ncbi:uncharacterized protein LOC144528010 [Sander vitreus]
MSKRKKEEISKMTEETGHSKPDVKERQGKTEEQRSEQRLEVNMEDRFDKQKLKLQQVQHEETLFEKDNVDSNTKNKVNTDMRVMQAEEIRKMDNTREEMLKAQTNMDQNNEEVKKYMDKMTSMKTQVSKWIMTESAIKKIFLGKTSKLQEPWKETDQDPLEDQIFEIQTTDKQTDKEGVRDESTNESMSLQQSITLEDQHQREKIKDQEHMHLEHKQREELNVFAVDMKEEHNVFLQMQTEIHKETSMDDDQTELVINVREVEEVEKQMSKLKEREEKIWEQIKYAMGNMEEINQEIKRLIMEINDLQSQKLETEKGLQITVWESTNVFKHEVIKYEVKILNQEIGNKVKQDSLNDVQKQKQGQESGDNIQTHTEEIDGGSDKMDTGSAHIQRLRAEIYRTQEIIKIVNLQLENQAEEMNINKDHKDKDSETEGLLQDMKQFQELLKLVTTEMRKREMHLKEEMSNMKLMRTAAKKQRRQLDQRLDKSLRERDEFDILKIKMQRQTEVNEQTFGKLAKVKSTAQKIAAKTRQKSKDIEVILKEAEEKRRQLEDLNYKIHDTKQELENIHPLRKKTDRAETDTEQDMTKTKNRMGKEMEEMENEIVRLKSEKETLEKNIKLTIDSLDQKNCETEQLKKALSEQVKQKIEREEIDILKQQILVERENVGIERQKAEAEIHEMNHLRERIERQKQELDNKVQMTKRHIREMELLKSELEIKKKESEQIFRKSRRKKEECEIKMNDIQREKEVLRRETKKRRRELDQRLEETLRERDESDMLRIKLQRQEEELAEEKQRIKDQTTLLQVNREHEKNSLEQQEVKSIKEKVEIIHQSSKFTDSIIDLQNWRQKMYIHLEIIRREMGILENVNVHLGKQKEGLKALKAQNSTVRGNMSRIKYQLKTDFEKMTIKAKAEMDEMVHIRDDIQKQKQELEIKLEYVKRERREMQVLKTELEISKRENQQLIRKGIRKEQEGKKMWAEVKGEKDVLKRETQKRKKELDQRLERINRERDELEIMKLKMQRKNDRSKDVMKESRMAIVTNIPDPIQLRNKHEFKYVKMKDDTHEEIQEIEEIEQQEEDNVMLHFKQIEKAKGEELEPNKEKSAKNIVLKVEGIKRMSDVVNEKRGSEMMSKEKLDLELMRSDILKQSDILEQVIQDIKEEKDKLEITKTELQQKKEHADSQFDEINREKINIKDMTLQLQTERDKLDNVMDMITLKQEEQQLKEEEFKRQTQELETTKNRVLVERNELELLRKDLNRKKEEIEAAMNTISGEREQLNQMKCSTDMDRRMLENEKDRMEGERSELTIREHQLLNEMKSIEQMREKTETAE